MGSDVGHDVERIIGTYSQAREHEEFRIGCRVLLVVRAWSLRRQAGDASRSTIRSRRRALLGPDGRAHCLFRQPRDLRYLEAVRERRRCRDRKSLPPRRCGSGREVAVPRRATSLTCSLVEPRAVGWYNGTMEELRWMSSETLT